MARHQDDKPEAEEAAAEAPPPTPEHGHHEARITALETEVASIKHRIGALIGE